MRNPRPRRSPETILHDLQLHASRWREGVAQVLAYIGELDARRLYLRTGHSSMFDYCVAHLQLSEDDAHERVLAAHVARRFPSIFERVAEGRVHLSAVLMLAPHLTEANAEELLDAVAGGTVAEIDAMLTRRFGRPVDSDGDAT